MKRPVLLPFLLLFTAGTATAQPRLVPTEVDSLRALWQDDAQPDSIRLKAVQQLIRRGYLITRPDSAYYYPG